MTTTVSAAPGTTPATLTGRQAALLRQLPHFPHVTGVAITGAGLHSVEGSTDGTPDRHVLIGGVHVSIWGDDLTAVDTVMALAVTADTQDREIATLAAALSQANDHQVGLHRLTSEDVSSLDRDSVVSRLLTHALELTGSDVSLLLGSDGRTWIVGDQTGDLTAITDLAGRAAGWTGDGNLPDAAGAAKTIARPIQVGERSFALALARFDGAAFGTPEHKTLDAVAASFVSALTMVTVHENSVNRAIIESDHATASQLVAAVQPAGVPAVPGIDAAARMLPARLVGGDYFTAVVHRGVLRFAVGDVAGKGLPAAVLMTNAVTVTNAVFERSRSTDPMEMLADIAFSLDSLLVGTNRFITMLVGTAEQHPTDPGRIKVSLANAGHSPVLVVRNAVVETCPPLTPPVGVVPVRSGLSQTYELGQDDCLFIGSDGIIEQDDEHGEMFGWARLEALTAEAVPAEELCMSIVESVARHAGSRPRADDQTVLAIKPAPQQRTITPDPLVLHADLFTIRELGPWLARTLDSLLRWSDSARMQPIVELVLHELAANVVQHAYDGNPGWLKVTAHVEDDHLVCALLDHGKPFDPADVAVPHPDVPQIRGYGLMITRQLATDVAYERAGSTNHWTVVFTIDPPTDAHPSASQGSRS